MKNLIYYILLTTILLLALNACNDLTVGPHDNISSLTHKARASFRISESANNINTFVLDAVNGNVEIIGSSNVDSIIVTGERIVASDSQTDADEHLKLLTVNSQKFTESFRVKTEQPDNSNGRNYTVNYKINVPQNISLDIDLVNGNIDIEDIIGNNNTDLVNGNITCKQTLPLNGSIDISSINGNIILNIPTTTSAEFNAATVNGLISTSNITISNQSSTLNSLRGNLGNADGNIALGLVNGNITLNGF